MRAGQSCEIRGVSGEGFVGTLSRTRAGPDGAISRVKVAGRSFYSSRCEFIAEEADPFGAGFVLPATFGDLLLPADSRFADKGRPRP
jgi:proline racemase